MSNVIVTGSQNGIGKALVKEGKARGYKVIGYDIETRGDITKEIELDVKPDILINCAGITAGGWIKDDFIVDQCKEVFEVNVFGMINVINWALKYMDKGAIINIASKSANKPLRNRLAYCVSKGAVVALSRQLALDLSPHIRVNSISPGTIDTEMPGSVVSTIDKPYNLLGIKGTVEEVAKLTYDIAENNYITGQDIRIDGGYE